MLRKTIWVMFLTLVMTPTTTAAQSTVDLALLGVGAGSVAEIKSRIFSRSFSVYGKEDFRKSIASLPRSVRESRITEGKLLQRVERVTKAVLGLHNRSDTVELFLSQDHFPHAIVWQGCVLVVSDSLADPLSDAELAGIIAHEMAHAYFMAETIQAMKHGDERMMRIVELKCDAVAMLTLKLMGGDAEDCLKGLRTLTTVTRRNGYAGKDSVHPSMDERTQFAERFLKRIV